MVCRHDLLVRKLSFQVFGKSFESLQRAGNLRAKRGGKPHKCGTQNTRKFSFQTIYLFHLKK